MAEQQCKLFVGGVSGAMTEAVLGNYFSNYGTVTDIYIKKDSCRTPRGGFGFVTFADASSLDRALQDQQHLIEGERVEVKRAMHKGQKNRDGNCDDQLSSKKIFVGGLSSSLTEEEFKNFFETFGRITDVVVMHDGATHRPRGFGFITFESEESVENVMQNNFYELNGKRVEVKRAVPKESNNNNKNPYNLRMGAGRGSSFPQNRCYSTYPPGYEVFSPYMQPYYYGTSMYPAGYFMGDYGMNAFPLRNPWNGPGRGGADSAMLPLGSPYMYTPYLNGMVGLPDMPAGVSNGLGGPRTISSFDSNTHFQADATLPQIDGNASFHLRDCNGNSNHPSLALNHSDMEKLDLKDCNGCSNLAGENFGSEYFKDDDPNSLYDDGLPSPSDSKHDFTPAPSVSKDDASSPSFSKDDGAGSPSDSKDKGAAFGLDLEDDGVDSLSVSKDNGATSPSNSKDEGAASPSDSKDNDTASPSFSNNNNAAAATWNGNTGFLECNGAASSSNLQNPVGQFKPSPVCKSS